MLENKNARHIVQKYPWMFIYTYIWGRIKTKEPNSWLVTTFVESVHTEVQEPPKWRRARKRQITLSVCILVCLCTYVKETAVNASPCFIAKRRWDHHMLVCWWHTLLAPLPCLSFKLSLLHFLYHCVCLYWVTTNNMNPIQMSFCFGFSECMCMCTVHAYKRMPYTDKT